MKIYLNYFKQSGKWYAQGDYEELDTFNGGPMPLYRIWEEVESLRFNGRLPGLLEGHSPFIISVNVPEHPHNHPHIILTDVRDYLDSEQQEQWVAITMDIARKLAELTDKSD